MASLHLGIDVGTSAVKVALVDDRGTVVATGRRDHAVSAPTAGWAESDPQHWWRGTVAATREVVAGRGADVASIGLSGQMHGVVLTGTDGHTLRPAVLWADARSDPQLRAYRRLPAPLRERLGNPPVAGMAGPTLAWLAEHEAGTLERAQWALQAKDWLRLRLVGDAATEPSDASATLLWDVTADSWNTEVADILGVPTRLLAPVMPSASVAGTLTEGAAAALGVSMGVPVAAGAADAAAAAVGTGLVDTGSLQLTIGTGAQLTTPVDAQTTQVGCTHQYRAAASNGWYAMAATLNAGLALGWVRRVTGVTWDELYDRADRPLLPDAPLFLPHLAGERTPYLDAGLRGAWVGLGLDHGRDDLLASALQGVALSIRDALDALGDTAPAGPVRLAGGGSSHPAWRRLLADVLDRPLVAVDAPDASARGAALLGAVAVGAVREADVGGRLAPATNPVAEPGPRAGELAARLTSYRSTVAHLRQVAAARI